jgi:hypothetical protein
MAASVDPSLVKDPAPWLISRGNMVARLTKSELEQLKGNLTRLPSGGDGITAPVTRAANARSSLAAPEMSSQTIGNHLPVEPGPAPYIDPQTSSTDFSIDDFNWQDGLTAEQLMNFADSMDLSALDWLSTGT